MPEARAELKSKRKVADFDERKFIEGLPAPQALSWIGPATSFDVAYRRVSQTYENDGREVVEWMRQAAAIKAVMLTAAASYEDMGGIVEMDCGDANIPGVRLSRSFYFESENGETIRRRGYAVLVHPYGRTNVPLGDKVLIVGKDFIGWAAVPAAWVIQWLGALIKFAKLARTPVRRAVLFPSVMGLTAPLFFEARHSLPPVVGTMSLTLTLDRSATVVVRFRSVDDYRDVIDTVEIDAEEGTYEYTIALFFYPARYVVEVDVPNNTRAKVERLYVSP